MSDTFGNIINGAAGTAQGREGTTVQTFVLSLSAGLVLFAVQFGAFLLVRNYFWAKRIYQPRSFLIQSKDRVKPPPNNPLRWLWLLLKTPNDLVLRKAGMDAYFFVRYLGMCLKIFCPMALVILPILIPINYTDGKGTNKIGSTRYNVTGLDTLAWSNVSPQHTSRYWAHLVLAVGAIIWVCYLFHHELLHYVAKRQEYLGSRSHRLKASSTTVLITDIPKSLCTNEALMALYDDFPGGVRRIWLNRNLEVLANKDALRRDYENRLENAETNLIRRVVKQYRKKRKEAGDLNSNEMSTLKAGMTNVSHTGNDSLAGGESIEPATHAACEKDLQHDLTTNALWTKFVTPKQRETMRIPRPNYAVVCKIPLVGRFFSLKVDTIYYCRRELARLNREIESDVEEAHHCPQNGSAFIQFNTQKAAHMACQAVANAKPGRMSQRMVEMSPADINWSALNYTHRNRAARLVVFVVLFAVLLFVFGLISFFTGTLSRASTLAGSTSWLHWIGTLPRWLLSFIQGTLPPVILVILLSGPTPIILRAMTNSTRGATTGSRGERSLQLWYFVLLLFEVFIIPTISSGLTSIVQELIHNTASVPEILATNLPTAANYYFSFLVLQALSISSSSILQTIRLLNFYVFASANTPDAVFGKLSFTWRTRIGSNIPWYTTFAVIGLVYSVIAPLILLFMLLTFSLFYIVIKNNVLYVIRTGDVDSGGLWVPSAINQTFTGLYFMEVCLIGLFFLVRDAHNKVSCEAQGIIMSVVFVLTVLYQIWLTVHFNGLFKYAPLQLEGDALLRDKEPEASRPASNVEEIGRASDETAAAKEKEIGSKAQIQDPAEETEQAEQASRTSSLTEKRRPSARSLSAAHPARRGTDMEEQKQHDNYAAKRILARLNRPLGGARLAQLEIRPDGTEVYPSNTFIPRKREVMALMMNDPISKIIMQHNDDLEALTSEERDMLVSVAFTHPVLRATRPSVWIPRDDAGVSDDEVRRTRLLSQDITIDNRGAFFNRKSKVEVDKPPPDMSEFALVMAEL
jgi:calcium permeable stress-gated cation channel